MFKLSTDIINLGDFLVNSRTGEAFGVDDNIKKLLCSDNIVRDSDNADIFDFMIEKNIISDTSLDSSKAVFHLQWHLLNSCNLRCKHCYDWKEKTKGLSLKQMFKFYNDFIFFVKSLDMRADVSLTGGEPTLFPDLIELIEYIKSRDIYTSVFILSNGVNPFSKDLLDCLIRHKVGVQISLDGLSHKHDYIRGEGTFEKSINTIKELLSLGIETTVHYVVMKNNIGDVEEFVRYIDNIGVSRINFSTLVPIGPGAQEAVASPEEQKQCLELLVRLQNEVKVGIIGARPLWALVGHTGVCPIGHGTLTIDAIGNIMPCRRLGMIIGNVLEDNLFDVWFNDGFLKKMRDRENNLEKCGKCKFLEKCAGCRAIASASSGNPLAADPSCWI